MSDINVKKNTQRDITHSDTKNVAYCNKLPVLGAEVPFGSWEA